MKEKAHQFTRKSWTWGYDSAFCLDTFLQGFKQKMREVADHSRKAGFWKGRVTLAHDAQCIALMHSELSEALEALRHGNPESEHLPGFSGVEEELADVVLRAMDYAARRKLLLGEAIVAKINFNKTRAYKHGGKKF